MLLSRGGRGGNYELADDLLDRGEGGASHKHVTCLSDKVILWRYMVLKGKRKDNFPGLNQERVDRGKRGGGAAGGSRTGHCLWAFALLSEALEAGPVHPEAVHSPFLARRPGDKALGKLFL